jgi:hypothetical protein
VTIEVDEHPPPIEQPTTPEPTSGADDEPAAPIDIAEQADATALVVVPDIPGPLEPPEQPEHKASPTSKPRKQLRTARRVRAPRRTPAQATAPQSATGPNDSTSTPESILLNTLSERVGVVEAALADSRRTQASFDQSLAEAVERATTDELVEAKQRVQVAASSMAYLALAISDSARNITTEVSAESAIELLASFGTEVENVLLQLGFSPLKTEIGHKFDATRHRSLRRVTTSNPELDRLISKVIRDGYQANGSRRILLYADVEVNRYLPEKNKSNQ